MRTPVLATIPRATASPAVDGSHAAQTESAVTQTSASVPEGEVTSATRKEFRSIISEAKEGARAVIRLGNRQRSGRDATEAEHNQFRDRQQNAEAAQNYLIYIDTLTRSMKSTQSETVAQQSLAKARQTLGYVTTMLADSKASLR